MIPQSPESCCTYTTLFAVNNTIYLSLLPNCLRLLHMGIFNLLHLLTFQNLKCCFWLWWLHLWILSRRYTDSGHTSRLNAIFWPTNILFIVLISQCPGIQFCVSLFCPDSWRMFRGKYNTSSEVPLQGGSNFYSSLVYIIRNSYIIVTYQYASDLI